MFGALRTPHYQGVKLDRGDTEAVNFKLGVILVITTEIDSFTTQLQEQQTDVVEPHLDSPTASELAEMVAIGATLKAYQDAQVAYKAAKTAFSSNFSISKAKRILVFRDAYWEKDKNGHPIGHVSVNGTKMAWSDFVETVFGVTRRWFNAVMKRTLFPTGNDNEVNSKSELMAYVKGLDEDGASALLAQIGDGFNTDDDPSDEEDEPALDDIDETKLDEEDEQPTVVGQATARIRELEAEIETLKARQTTEPQDEELMTEREKVLSYAKRIACGNAAVLQRVLVGMVETLGFGDRITVIIE